MQADPVGYQEKSPARWFSTRLSNHDAHPDDVTLRSLTTTWWTRFRIFFLAVGVVATVLAVLDPESSIAARVGSLVAFGVLAAWCWPFTYRSTAGDRNIVVFFVVAVPLFFVLASIHPAYYLLIAAVYWHLYMIVRTVPATIASIIFTLGLLASFGDGVIDLPLSSGPDWAVFAISVLAGSSMAAFISSLFREIRKRRDLIADLEATRARLAIEERQTGVLMERQRIAGEIHDTIAQDLTSVIMHLQASRQRLPSASHPAVTHLEEALRAARAGLSEARQIVRALLPEILADHSVEDALRDITDRWQATTGTPVTVTVIERIAAVPPQFEVLMVRFVQETLANVRKHARASSVTITLTSIGHHIAIDVNDNGIGIGASKPKHLDGHRDNGLGLGLQTLVERARTFDGDVAIESGTDGTTVSLLLKVPQAVDAESLTEITVS